MMTALGMALAAASCLVQADPLDDYLEFDGPPTVSVRFANRSDLAIRSLYLSPTRDGDWEDDLLGTGTLAPGYNLRVSKALGRYDLMLVDEDGDRCVVRDIALRGNRTVDITSEALLNCEGL
jgi:hypothetical protein